MKTITINMTNEDALTLQQLLEDSEDECVFNEPFSFSMEDLLDDADLSDIQPLPKLMTGSLTDK